MKLLPLFACLVFPALLPAQDHTPYLLDPAAFPPEELARQVQKAVASPLVTIVDKPRPSPTGDAHDYVSYGRYWWPDPAKPDGLPYLQKDGHPNYELLKFGDEKQLAAFINHLETLALGWSQLHREDCARRAGEWIRAWYLTPATRINPNFDYAQIRLGRDHNRGGASGLIDTRGLVRVIDALRLLHGAPGVTAGDEAAAQAWFAAYLHWLETSPNGRKEHEAKNNHGSWLLTQLIAINRYLGRDEAARACAREDFERINWQIEPDGRQPLEIVRTDGLSYSLFNLEAQLHLARLAAPLGVDLWNYTAGRGGSLRQALAYLKPFDGAPEKWPHQQLAKREPGFLKPHLEQAAKLDALLPAGNKAGPGGGS